MRPVNTDLYATKNIISRELDCVLLDTYCEATFYLYDQIDGIAAEVRNTIKQEYHDTSAPNSIFR